MTIIPLQSEISQVFNLLAVLLVFVLAYFSALLPQMLDALGDIGSAKFSILDDTSCAALGRRMRVYRWLIVGSLLLVALVGVLVLPLTVRVLRQSMTFQWSPPPTFSGLLLVDICLIAMLVTAGVFFLRLTRGINQTAARVEEPATTGLDS
ncbi:MAG TPA: hypothetical protein VMV09_08165 [Candidatus Saccharimonadales bacterium]|nr:hypothetical protein [Candidatus Saccharimonadales bacterium]